MKKIVALLLAILMFTSMAGCAGKEDAASMPEDTQKTAEQAEKDLGKPVVTVLMDLPVQVDYEPDEFSKTLGGLPGYLSDFMVRFESLPTTGIERDATFTRLRTELLAGKGPDLFLCAQRLYGVSAGPDDKPFFQFPVQAMNNHMLLPLDGYLEDAEYIEWDKLQPVVMAAGRNDEGQQIMPLTYTFSVTILDKEAYQPPDRLPMAWEEMAADPDPNLRFTANSASLQDIIGDIADYTRDVPTFSEDQLRTWAAKHFEIWESIPEDMKEERHDFLPLDRQQLEWHEINLSGEQEYVIVPAYNLDGGITANITTFAAINRNARQPKLAFKIIDYLMKPTVQQTSPLFQNRMEGIPVYRNTGDEKTVAGSWRMTGDNYRQLSAIEEQINVAKYPGPLDVCLWGVQAYNEEVLETSCHEQYVLLEMMLGES